MPAWGLLLVDACAITLAIAQTATLRSDAIPPEDPQLRARAVGLLEKANSLSSVAWPMNEETFHFRIVTPEPGEPDSGTLEIGVAAPQKKRWHFTYGGYELEQVQTGIEFARVQTGPEPAAVTLVRKMVPVNLIRFDHEDIIGKIQNEAIDKTPARCIYFETIFGDRRQSGKVCVDAASGFLIYLRTGEMIVHQSKFFRFNNGYLPGHLERWTGDRKIADIDESVEVRESFSPGYFDNPAGAVISHACSAFQSAFAESIPQPPVKSNSDNVIDIVVHGRISADGRPIELKALDTTHQELANEAVKIISEWTYTPAQCDYKPTTQLSDFTVHFKGWE